MSPQQHVYAEKLLKDSKVLITTEIPEPQHKGTRQERNRDCSQQPQLPKIRTNTEDPITHKRHTIQEITAKLVQPVQGTKSLSSQIGSRRERYHHTNQQPNQINNTNSRRREGTRRQRQSEAEANVNSRGKMEPENLVAPNPRHPNF